MHDAHAPDAPPEALDALDALATLSPEYGPGFTDHAPMVVEALDRLAPEALDEAEMAEHDPLHAAALERWLARLA